MAMSTEGKKETAFSEAAREKPSLVKDWLQFLKASRKWWLIPMMVLMLMLAALFVLSSTVAAPFIYTLF